MMRIQVFAAVALLAVAGVAQAQAPQDKRQAADQRQALRERRQEMLKERREAMQPQRGDLKQQRDQMLAQRRELLSAMRDEEKQLRDDVKSGKLTKDEARAQLRAWRQEHKPVRPKGTKQPDSATGV